MTTFADLVDRTLRDWLVPPDDQPLRFRLEASLTSSATELAYDAGMLSPELEQLLGPGVLVEAGFEQILLGPPGGGTVVGGLFRGVNGTAPAEHASGSLVTIAPVFGRQTVFDALADAVELLHPRLFRLRSTPMTVGNLFNEAPEDMLLPDSFTFVDHFGLPAEVSAQFSTRFSDSSTGKVVVVQATPGTAGHLNYRARFPRPGDPADTLESLGLRDSWAQLLTIGAVQRVIGARDIEAATQEHLTRQLAQQGFPVLSAARIRDGLVNYYEYLMATARADLMAEQDVTIVRTFPQESMWR